MVPSRPLFWQIDSVWLFYALAFISVGLFIFGVTIRAKIWFKIFKNIQVSKESIIKVFFEGILGRRIIKGDLAAGIMHSFIFWGFSILFAGTVLSTVDHYIVHYLKGTLYLIFSLIMELAGLMLVTGVIWALIRRYSNSVVRLEKKREDLIIPVWILLAGITGFMVEGARIAAQDPTWAKWSFAGGMVSFLFSKATSPEMLYGTFWWIHALLCLGLIAVIPYTKLFHMIAGPLNMYLIHDPVRQDTVKKISISQGKDLKDSTETYSFRERLSFDACMRCGRCSDVCPSTNANEPFSPRDFIQWAGTLPLNTPESFHPLPRLDDILQKNNNMEENAFTTEKIWHCTTCSVCLEVCPVYISTPDPIIRTRNTVVEEGKNVPAVLNQTFKKLFKYNNPWEASKIKRAQWAKGLDIPDFSKNKTKTSDSICYFVGCTTAIETRAQGLAKSFTGILKQADISFGTFGNKEPCCGDIARRLGENGLFQEQAKNCLDFFTSFNVNELVVSSPHCFNTIQNEYQKLASEHALDDTFVSQVFHYSQFLNKMIKQDVIRFKKELNVRVTYHDPCYLGRYNGIYDAPREVIQSIPGIKLIEMENVRELSRCCGGGGGRMWQEGFDSDVKMSENRIKEAKSTGAQIVITACPLCLIMLEDARKTSGFEDTLKVMDLNELVFEAMS